MEGRQKSTKKRNRRKFLQEEKTKWKRISSWISKFPHKEKIKMEGSFFKHCKGIQKEEMRKMQPYVEIWNLIVRKPRFCRSTWFKIGNTDAEEQLHLHFNPYNISSLSNSWPLILNEIFLLSSMQRAPTWCCYFNRNKTNWLLHHASIQSNRSFTTSWSFWSHSTVGGFIKNEIYLSFLLGSRTWGEKSKIPSQLHPPGLVVLFVARLSFTPKPIHYFQQLFLVLLCLPTHFNPPTASFRFIK